MRTWLAILTGAFAGVCLAFGLALNGTAEHAAHVQQQTQAQVQQLRAELAAVAGKAAGAHRDLITCADLQQMGLTQLFSVSLNTDANGTMFANPDLQPVPLPSHCINQ